MSSNSAEYRRLLKKLDVSQGEAARFLGVTKRTSERWAGGDQVPWHVILLLRLMAHDGRSISDVKRLTAGGPV